MKCENNMPPLFASELRGDNKTGGETGPAKMCSGT